MQDYGQDLIRSYFEKLYIKSITLTSKIFGRFIFRTKVASENIIVPTLKRPNNLTVRKFNCPEMSEILILPKF